MFSGTVASTCSITLITSRWRMRTVLQIQNSRRQSIHVLSSISDRGSCVSSLKQLTSISIQEKSQLHNLLVYNQCLKTVKSMAQLISVKLSRFDACPWGFRLQGGKDFGAPLLIQKVRPKFSIYISSILACLNCYF